MPGTVAALSGLPHGHAIKVAALITAVSCAAYLIWHGLIRGRTTPRSVSRPQQHPRRQRRIYTSTGKLTAPKTSDVALVALRSEEYISHPRLPVIVTPVRPVLSSDSEGAFYRPPKPKRSVSSHSRSLVPGKKRPITAIVNSKLHSTLPAGVTRPPPGYAPVHTNHGEVLWQRIPTAIRQMRLERQRQHMLRTILRQRLTIDRSGGNVAAVFIPLTRDNLSGIGMFNFLRQNTSSTMAVDQNASDEEIPEWARDEQNRNDNFWDDFNLDLAELVTNNGENENADELERTGSENSID